MRWVANLWWRLIRFGFRLLYNELAFTYDLVSKVVSVGAWRCWQRSALKFLPEDAFVLELAHGTGDLQIDLKAAGYRTIGYDLSPYMGRITQRKLQRHGLDAILARGRAQQLPFKDRTFDSVVCTFPTEFIFTTETLQEVYRILSNEGRLIVVPNGTLLGGGILRDFLEWLYRITGQRGDETVFNAKIIAFMDQYGFKAEIHVENCIRKTAAQVIICYKKV